MHKYMRMMLVVLVAGSLLAMSGCSSFTKKAKAQETAATTETVTPAAPAAPETPPSAEATGPRAGDLVAFPDGTVVTIYFDFDKSDIRADQLANADKNLEYLKANADVKVYIEGNCDERGTTEYNFALGNRRAQAVQEYFIKGGIAADRIIVASKGEENPADPGHTEEAWAKNRRALFMRAY